MPHLKHASSTRRAAAAKRAVLTEQQRADAAMVASWFSEENLLAADRAEPSAADKVQREADRAQSVELQRMPGGGYLS